MNTVLLDRLNAACLSRWKARSFALIGLCLLVLLATTLCLQLFALESRIKESASEVAQLQRALRLGEHFEARYRAIASARVADANPRVSWTGFLQNAFVGLPDSDLTFSIADPVIVPVEFSGRQSGVIVTEYLVQLSASLKGDAELMDLLARLEGIDAQFMRNRSCTVERSTGETLLRMHCVYSIFDASIKENKL